MVKIKWFPIFVESGSHDPNITYFPPETAFKYLTSIRSDSQFLKCPALRSFLKNTFIIKSPYNYRLEIDPATKGINADRFGKEFFENNIHVHLPTNPKDKVIVQTFPKYLFMSDSKKPVHVTVLPWFFKPNNYSVIPGSFDITKWIRPVNLAIEAHGPVNLDYRRGEPLYCVQFDCEDDVEFELGEMTPELSKAVFSSVCVQKYVHGMSLKALYEQGAHYVNLIKSKVFK